MTTKKTTPRKTKVTTKPKGKPGRNPVYDKRKLKPQIIKLLKRGFLLNEIADMPGYPSEDTIYDWLDDEEVFSRRYAHTRARSGPSLLERAHKRLVNSTPEWIPVDREIANHFLTSSMRHPFLMNKTDRIVKFQMDVDDFKRP